MKRMLLIAAIAILGLASCNDRDDDQYAKRAMAAIAGMYEISAHAGTLCVK